MLAQASLPSLPSKLSDLQLPISVCAATADCRYGCRHQAGLHLSFLNASISQTHTIIVHPPWTSRHIKTPSQPPLAPSLLLLQPTVPCRPTARPNHPHPNLDPMMPSALHPSLHPARSVTEVKVLVVAVAVAVAEVWRMGEWMSICSRRACH